MFVHVLFLLYFFISGLGTAIGWTASLVCLNFYFRKYRNLAIGIAISGTGVGIFGVPALVTWSESQTGTRGFFISFACVTAQMIVCGAVTRPSRLEICARKKRRIELNDDVKQNICISYWNTFKSKAVICLSLSMFMYCSGMYIVFLYLPRYCILQGSTEQQASNIISICGISSVVGRVMSGALANVGVIKLRAAFIYGGSLLLLAAVTCLFRFFSHVYVGQVSIICVTNLYV